MKQFALLILAAGIIAACASISEDSCRAGNWYEIGLRDGTHGHLESRVANYAEDCAEYGIVPNRRDWLRGRAEGLKTYCTPANAYQIGGTTGHALRPVCPDDPALKLANARGQHYHDLDEELDDLKREQIEIETLIEAELALPETEQDADLVDRYHRLLRRIEDRISLLRRQLRSLPKP